MKQGFGTLAAGLALGAALVAHSGNVLADGSNAIFAQLPDAPEGIAIDSKGTMYATTINGQQVYRINDDGSSELVATTSIDQRPSPRSTTEQRGSAKESV
ncbi:MAG: hypothetical protein QGF53_03175 [Alphaproteobacteria bacterium]|jgi:sugar lactone lactonase YvrE|nr:hypothetical protein [Alphaproteobacteria bacterium]